VSYHRTGMQGLGQLSMPTETQAKLQSCMNVCESQYGVSSGHPDFIQISLCFANCNAMYPPTIATPTGPVTPTIPTVLPTVKPPEKPQPFPLTLPTPAALDVPTAPVPMQAGMSGGMKFGLAAAGVIVVGGGGYWLAKKKGWIK